MLRLLLDTHSLTMLIELHDAKTLRIIDIIAEYGRTFSVLRILHGSLQSLLKSVPEEDIVAQHHRHKVITDKVRTDNKRLCQSIRTRLHCIGQIHAKLMAVTEQLFKSGRISRRGNNQNIPNASIHQHDIG